MSNSKEYGIKWRANHPNYQKIWRTANREKTNNYRAKWRLDNPELSKQELAEWKKNNKEHIKQYQTKWIKENSARANYLTAKYQAQKSRATPIWLTKDDFWMMNEAYELAELRSKLTKVKHHVDHFYPLRGKTVCGLHIPVNLQVIPAIDNMRKHNKCLS